MNRDKLKVYMLESIISIVFFFTLFVSSTYLRAIIASIVLVSWFVVKKVISKRNTISLYHKQATILLGLLSVVFLLIFYMLGLYFGFGSALIKFDLKTLFIIIIPTAIIIIFSEIIRSIFLTEKSVISKVLTTICMIFIDLALYTNMSQLSTYDGFISIISFSLLASIAGNLLWNYTSKRFGYKPAIVFRLIMTLYEFIIPIIPNVFIYLRCFLRILYPYIIYLILEVLYSKNTFVVALKDKKRDNIITAVLIVIMTLIIMLISCEFKYGLLVIATGSMQGTIDIGDAVIYESYDNQKINEQQVIIFKKDKMNVVHRVVDIKEVNGVIRYYTKGDANKQKDTGYVVKEDIVGVVKFKVKYIGYPTLALREMF